MLESLISHELLLVICVGCSVLHNLAGHNHYDAGAYIRTYNSLAYRVIEPGSN